MALHREKPTPLYSETSYTPIHTSQASLDPADLETPKLASSSSSSSRARPIIGGLLTRFGSSAVHVVPVAATAVLLWLNHARVFWYPVTGAPGIRPNVVNNLLQIVAKLYEISVFMSLGEITLKIFKRHLVRSSIPFGLLTAGYRVGDLLFLPSSSFWRNFSRRQGTRVFLIALFFVFITVLLTIIGPASAILIIPELGWHPLPGAFSRIAMPILVERPEVTWPSNLTYNDFYSLGDEQTGSAGFDLRICSRDYGLTDSRCPASGYSTIENWASSFAVTGLSRTIGMYEAALNLNRQLVVNPNATTVRGPDDPQPERAAAAGSAVAMGSTLSRPLFNSIGYFLKWIDGRDVGAASRSPQYLLRTTDEARHRQPLVQTQCAIYDFEETPDRGSIRYRADGVDCFGVSLCEQLRERVADFVIEPRVHEGDTHSFVTTLDIFPDQADGSGAGEKFSLVAIEVGLNNGRGNLLEAEYTGYWYMPCVSFIHWVPSVVTAEPNATRVIRSNWEDLNDAAKYASLREKFMDLPVEERRPVSVDFGWLEFLDPRSVEFDSDSDVYFNEENPVRRRSGKSHHLQLKRQDVVTGNSTDSDSVFDDSDDSPDDRYVENDTFWNLLYELVFFVGEDPYFFPGSGTTDTNKPVNPEEARLAMQQLVSVFVTDAAAHTAPAFQPRLILDEDSGSTVLVQLDVLEGIDAGANVTYRWAADGRGATVLDGFSPDKAEYETDMTREEFQAQLGRFTTVDFRPEQFGWANGNPSGTLIFGLAVTYVYVATLAVYCVASLWRLAFSVSAWDDVQDIITLAWTSSPPPEIRSALQAGGPEVLSTPVSIQADHNGKVQLVMGDNPQMARLRRDTQYE